jgi:hypothetical protein
MVGMILNCFFVVKCALEVTLDSIIVANVCMSYTCTKNNIACTSRQ